jgi:hypothetical protein
MSEPVRIPTYAEMPRVPVAQAVVDEDFFYAYADLVGAVVLVYEDGTERIFMSVAVGEAFIAAEAETAVREAEHAVLQAELRRLEKERYRLTHPLRHRCETQPRRGAGD